MRQAEYDNYRQKSFEYSGMSSERVFSSELDSKDDRTLVYGYTVDRETFHVYLEGGIIHRVIYNFHNALLDYKSEPDLTAADCYPDKRSYPESCDEDFSYLMAKHGQPLCFTNFDAGRAAKVVDLPYHGERLCDLHDLRTCHEEISASLKDINVVGDEQLSDWLDDRNIFKSYGSYRQYDECLKSINRNIAEVAESYLYKCLTGDDYDFVSHEDKRMDGVIGSIEYKMKDTLSLVHDIAEFSFTDDERIDLASRLFDFFRKLHVKVVMRHKFGMRGSSESVLSETQIHCVEGFLTPLKVTAERNLEILFQKDAMSRSLLFYACAGGQVDCAKFLMESGLNPDDTDFLGATLLHHACDSAQQRGLVELLAKMVKDVDRQDAFGWTALMRAVAKRDAESVCILLDRGASLSLKNAKGLGVFELAEEKSSRKGMVEIIGILNSAKDGRLLDKSIDNELQDEEVQAIGF